MACGEIAADAIDDDLLWTHLYQPEMPPLDLVIRTAGEMRLSNYLLWQISYARQAAIHENLDYDLYYIENQSFLLDVVIIALTGFAVVKGTGAY